jgi:DNA repair exonuclease SbcCD nuclease subunit
MQSNLNADKARRRKLELISTFERMVDYAKDNGVRAIIIAGDMFDTSRVTAKSRSAIFDKIKNNPEIDFLYLAGNHDEENILSQLEESYDNLKVFKDEWTTYTYGGTTTITGAKLDGKNKGIYDTLVLDKNTFNVVVLHGQISRYDLKDNSEVVNLAKLKNKNIDYLALGHYHTYDIGKVDDRGIYCYSGCIEGRGFDECGDKGFVLLDIDDGKLKYDFVPFALRKLHEVHFDISGYNDWFDIERKALDEVSSIDKNDLVKLVLEGKYKISLDKQPEHLELRLNSYFFYAKIKDESTLEISAKDYEKDPSLRGQFIREVLASDLSEEDKESVILVGLKALDGEE